MTKNETAKRKPMGLLSFSLLSVLIGVIAGLGAAMFRSFIVFFHNLLFLGKLSLIYDANVHTPPSPWGPFVILVPVVGALGVAFLIKNFAPEAKGHGVPEVMDAIYYNKGVIRPIVALIKALASALSIGSGGAIGREGPIIQIGSSFGSSVGQPNLQTPYFHLTDPLVLPSYVGLGVIMGLFSALFIRSIYGFEDFFDKRVKGNYYSRHMTGMFLVGMIMYILMTTQGQYYIEGVGYSTVQTILTGALSSPYLILILFVLKLLATSLTLGSGASGGIFSPALFRGAALGGAYGIILHHFFPGLAISPPAFAAAGMAGMVGGATGAGGHRHDF